MTTGYPVKFSQITASLANFSTADFMIGVQNGTSDRLWSFSQVIANVFVGVGSTGTGLFVLDHSPTIGTATLNNPIISTAAIGTSTINNSTINTATINNSTINTAVISRSTLNTATINTAIINTSTINGPTVNNGVFSAPILNNPALNTATISTATITNATISTATINNGVLNTATINTGTLNNVSINTAIIGTSTLNTPTLNTATVNTATINNATINTATIGTSTINNSTIGTGTINNSTLGTATINNSAINTGTLLNSSVNLLQTIAASQLGSAVLTSFPAGYAKIRIDFENVCPVSTALLTTSLNLQVATSGTSFVSASYLSHLVGFVAGTTFIIGTTSLFYLSGITATTCVGTSTIYGVNGWVEITNPGNGVFRKSLRGELNYLTPGSVATTTDSLVMPSGFWDGAANAISAIAIAFQTGNIATGTIRSYGIK